MIIASIIALTADAEEATLNKVLSVGMDDRMVKPFDTAALQTMLEKLSLRLQDAGAA